MNWFLVVVITMAVLYFGFALYSFLKWIKNRKTSVGHAGLMDNYIKTIAEIEVQKEKDADAKYKAQSASQQTSTTAPKPKVIQHGMSVRKVPSADGKSTGLVTVPKKGAPATRKKSGKSLATVDTKKRRVKPKRSAPPTKRAQPGDKPTSTPKSRRATKPST